MFLFRFLSLSVSGRAAPEEHQEQYSHHSLYTLHSYTLLYTIGKLRGGGGGGGGGISTESQVLPLKLFCLCYMLRKLSCNEHTP